MGKVVHGQSTYGNPTPEYVAYSLMKQRCYGENGDRYQDYGGRGITVCDRWLHGDGERSGFECFFQDMGHKPTPGHSLDRRDNNQGYAPGNCKWSTREEQASNKRNNRLYDIGCGPMLLKDLVSQFGTVSWDTARQRIHKGWPVEAAVRFPKSARRPKIEVAAKAEGLKEIGNG